MWWGICSFILPCLFFAYRYFEQASLESLDWQTFELALSFIYVSMADNSVSFAMANFAIGLIGWLWRFLAVSIFWGEGVWRGGSMKCFRLANILLFPIGISACILIVLYVLY